MWIVIVNLLYVNINIIFQTGNDLVIYFQKSY
jgi:hypothetical protein